MGCGLPPRQLLDFLYLWVALSVGGTDDDAQRGVLHSNDKILITHLVASDNASRLYNECPVSQPHLLLLWLPRKYPFVLLLSISCFAVRNALLFLLCYRAFLKLCHHHKLTVYGQNQHFSSLLSCAGVLSVPVAPCRWCREIACFS
jgi:hypothetical protein